LTITASLLCISATEEDHTMWLKYLSVWLVCVRKNSSKVHQQA